MYLLRKDSCFNSLSRVYHRYHQSLSMKKNDRATTFFLKQISNINFLLGSSILAL